MINHSAGQPRGDEKISLLAGGQGGLHPVTRNCVHFSMGYSPHSPVGERAFPACRRERFVPAMFSKGVKAKVVEN